MSILSDANTPVFSLDIETTSLDHKKSKVWSVGISGQKYEQEFFQKDVIPSNTRNDRVLYNLYKEHKKGGAEDFFKDQNNKGAYNNYKKRFNSNILSSMDDTFNVLSMNLKNNAGVFLVQNLNFESEAFGQAKDKTGGQNLSEDSRRRFLANIFGVDPELTKNNSKFIPQDKRILDARKELNNSMKIFKKSSEFSQETISNFKGMLKDSSSKLEETLNKVVKENMDRGFSTAIDLMDVTKIYTAKLALQDGIGAGYVGTGLSVDYLSRELLGEAEEHTALSDARQQRKIFEILTRRIDAINTSGALSEEDLKYGSRLMESDVHEKTFISNIRNRLTEGLNKNKKLTSNQVSEILSNSIEDYSSIPEKANFNRTIFANDIKKSFLKDPSEAFSKLKTAENADLRPDTRNLPVPDESPLLRKGGMSKNSKILMGLSALGVVSMMGSNNRKSKREELTSYDDLYENVYLGQEYANWQERNNAHKMIY